MVIFYYNSGFSNYSIALLISESSKVTIALELDTIVRRDTNGVKNYIYAN